MWVSESQYIVSKNTGARLLERHVILARWGNSARENLGKKAALKRGRCYER